MSVPVVPAEQHSQDEEKRYCPNKPVFGTYRSTDVIRSRIAYNDRRNHIHYTLTLHEEAWLRDGPILASDDVIGYRVGGT